MLLKNKKIRKIIGFTLVEVLIASFIFFAGTLFIYSMLNSKLVQVDRDYLEALNLASLIVERERAKEFRLIRNTHEYSSDFERFNKDTDYIKYKDRYIYKIDVMAIIPDDMKVPKNYAIEELISTTNPEEPSKGLPYYKTYVADIDKGVFPLEVGKLIEIEVRWRSITDTPDDQGEFKKDYFKGSLKMKSFIINRNVRYDIKVD